MKKKINHNHDDDYSVDLIKLLKDLWKSRKFILKITLLFSVIGLIYSYSLINTYTASSIFYPHYESNDLSNSSGIKGLAGLVGIDIGSEKSQNIPPTLYPNIIKSPQFKIELLDSDISLNKDRFSFREYLINNKTYNFNIKKVLLFPILQLAKFFSKNKNNFNTNNIDILSLSEEEFNLHEKLSNRVSLQINEKEGFIELKVKDSNPLVASQIAKTANKILQKNYRL